MVPVPTRAREAISGTATPRTPRSANTSSAAAKIASRFGEGTWCDGSFSGTEGLVGLEDADVRLAHGVAVGDLGEVHVRSIPCERPADGDLVAVAAGVRLDAPLQEDVVPPVEVLGVELEPVRA